MQVQSLADMVVGRFRTTLFIVLAAVGLLLLIGCGNVANLLLARATAREKEFAIRAALGASRWRLVRQLLVESLVLALGGAALGAFMAWGGLKALIAVIPPRIIPAEAVIRLNGTVLLFTLAVAVMTAVVFGLVPALQVSRRDLVDPLRDSGKGTSGGFRHGRLRDAVVVLEVALSLALLVGAGLLMRSFVALREVDLGLSPDHVLVARLPLPQDRYKTAEQLAGFYRPLLARLKALAGSGGGHGDQHAAALRRDPQRSRGRGQDGSGEVERRRPALQRRILRGRAHRASSRAGRSTRPRSAARARWRW